jgi:hypothetical protein
MPYLMKECSKALISSALPVRELFAQKSGHTLTIQQCDCDASLSLSRASILRTGGGSPFLNHTQTCAGVP